jgi:inosine/xanthosine triphosphatase
MIDKPIKVVVGSNNPVKIAAVANAFKTLFNELEINVEGMHAPSQVADQPMTSDETREGAQNRVHYCQQHNVADYFVAIEGGVDLFTYGPSTFAYVVVADHQRVSVGRSADLPLPHSIYKALLEGQELGDVMDGLFNTENIKQKGGAIGLLTNGHASRESNYTQATILALSPFLHPQLYPI